MFLKAFYNSPMGFQCIKVYNKSHFSYWIAGISGHFNHKSWSKAKNHLDYKISCIFRFHFGTVAVFIQYFDDWWHMVRTEHKFQKPISNQIDDENQFWQYAIDTCGETMSLFDLFVPMSARRLEYLVKKIKWNLKIWNQINKIEMVIHKMYQRAHHDIENIPVTGLPILKMVSVRIRISIEITFPYVLLMSHQWWQ